MPEQSQEEISSNAVFPFSENQVTAVSSYLLSYLPSYDGKVYSQPKESEVPEEVLYYTRHTGYRVTTHKVLEEALNHAIKQAMQALVVSWKGRADEYAIYRDMFDTAFAAVKQSLKSNLDIRTNETLRKAFTEVLGADKVEELTEFGGTATSADRMQRNMEDMARYTADKLIRVCCQNTDTNHYLQMPVLAQLGVSPPDQGLSASQAFDKFISLNPEFKGQAVLVHVYKSRRHSHVIIHKGVLDKVMSGISRYSDSFPHTLEGDTLNINDGSSFRQDYSTDVVSVLGMDKYPDEKDLDAIRSNPLTGCELETSWDNGNRCNQHLNKIIMEDGMNKFIGKSDSSINGNYGIEFVSKPMQQEAQKELWSRLLEKFAEINKERANEVRSGQSVGCGVHIHVDRKALTPLTLSKMLVFVNKKENVDFVTRIAKRNSAEWAAFKEKNLESGNPENAFNSGRYEAINLTKSPTVEFRIFAGTTKASQMLSYIDFVYATVDFCKKTNRYRLSSGDFVAWLARYKSKRERYPHLCKVIAGAVRRRDIDDTTVQKLIDGGIVAKLTPDGEVASKMKALKEIEEARKEVQKSGSEHVFTGVMQSTDRLHSLGLVKNRINSVVKNRINSVGSNASFSLLYSHYSDISSQLEGSTTDEKLFNILNKCNTSFFNSLKGKTLSEARDASTVHRGFIQDVMRQSYRSLRKVHDECKLIAPKFEEELVKGTQGSAIVGGVGGNVHFLSKPVKEIEPTTEEAKKVKEQYIKGKGVYSSETNWSNIKVLDDAGNNIGRVKYLVVTPDGETPVMQRTYETN